VESAPPSCDTMLTGPVKDDDEQIFRVASEATLTGAQLIDWLNNREKVHFLHPETAFPGLNDAEVVRVCLFEVAGFPSIGSARTQRFTEWSYVRTAHMPGPSSRRAWRPRRISAVVGQVADVDRGNRTAGLGRWGWWRSRRSARAG
jgi:hypothetical protein